MDKHGKFIPRNKRRESNVSQAQPTKVRELEWGRTAMEVAAGVGGGASAGGSGICEHGRQKHQCKECSGSGMYRKSRFDQPPTGLHAHTRSPLSGGGKASQVEMEAHSSVGPRSGRFCLHRSSNFVLFSTAALKVTYVCPIFGRRCVLAALRRPN